MKQFRISAVLLSWRRQHHVPEIVRNLRQCPEIDDITIWQNQHIPTDEVFALGETVIHSPENECVLGRFLAARDARHEMLYFQDDDVLVHNLPSLIERYREEACIAANLADDRSGRAWTWWQFNRPPYIHLGFGALVPRSWALSVLGWPYDRDILRRKADKVLTVLYPWKAVWAGGERLTRLMTDGQETGRDAHALYKRADHAKLTDEAVRMSREWKEKQ